MPIYEEVLEDIRINGESRKDRTGTGTLSSFGKTIRYNLEKHFPLITSKFVPLRLIESELKWFLKGGTNIHDLHKDNNHIWDEWRIPYDNTLRKGFIPQWEKITQHHDYSDSIESGALTEREMDSFIWSNASIATKNNEEFRLWRAMSESGDPVYPGWHDFEVFLEDLPTIPHYFYWKNDPDNFHLNNEFFFPDNSENQVWAPHCVIFARNDRYDFNPQGFTNMRCEPISNEDMGVIYGSQWRNWNGEYDQIQKLIKGLKEDPFSRRHIVSAWNVSQLHNMALPPCHVMFQCYVSKENKLSLQIYQRSADMFLGVPFNIASYALLAHVIAKHCGFRLGELIWVGGDCHIYTNHIAQVDRQIFNYKNDKRELPTISVDIKNSNDISEFSTKLSNYNPVEKITGEISI